MYHILSGLPWEHDRFHLLTHYRITIGSGRDYTYVYEYIYIIYSKSGRMAEQDKEREECLEDAHDEAT